MGDAPVASAISREAVAELTRLAAAAYLSHGRRANSSRLLFPFFEGPMFGALARRLFGSANDRYVKSLGPIVAAINELEPRARSAVGRRAARPHRSSSSSGSPTARSSTTS